MQHKLDMRGIEDKPARPNWWTMRTAMLVVLLVGAAVVFTLDHLDHEREAARTTLKMVPCQENLDCGEFGWCDDLGMVCRTLAAERTVFSAATGKPQNQVRYDLVFSALPLPQMCKDPPWGWVPPQTDVTREDPCVWEVEISEVFAYEIILDPQRAQLPAASAQRELECPTELNEPTAFKPLQYH